MFNSPKFHMNKFAQCLRLGVGLSLLSMAALTWAAAEPTKTSAAAITGLGRAATPAEVAAWDIDVRPDFKGLPKGSGSVAKGQDIWETKCAQCHGVFGESNEVFSSLVGGTTAQDVKTGKVARLLDRGFPGRTTLMKVATISTLFDYINRAMPWTQPKSLKPDEVYSLVAFLLNLGGVVPDNFTLSNANMAEVQAKMPNRNGMTTAHGMWPGKELGGKSQGDIKAVACMSNCEPEVKVSSFLPDFARNAHGNLAEQNRAVGQQKGADTSKPEKAGLPVGGAAPAATTSDSAAKGTSAEANANKAAIALVNKSGCMGCHAMSQKLVGPAFTEVAKKYAGKADYIAGKIKSGSTGVWGIIPMPAQTLGEAETKSIAAWLAAGAQK